MSVIASPARLTAASAAATNDRPRRELPQLRSMTQKTRRGPAMTKRYVTPQLHQASLQARPTGISGSQQQARRPVPGVARVVARPTGYSQHSQCYQCYNPCHRCSYCVR